MAQTPTPRTKYTHDAVDSPFTERTYRKRPTPQPIGYILGGAVAGWLAHELYSLHVIAEFLGL